MTKILLCCGAGFSSSTLSTRIAKEIAENNLQDEYFIEYSPFRLAINKMSEFDIVVCCPHLIMAIDNLLKESDPGIPIYIIPPRMYGLMRFKELVLDIIDIIDIYNKNKVNPAHFPGEEKTLKISRFDAYRNRVATSL